FSDDQLLGFAASAERGSEHPLGEAIVRAAQERGVQLDEATTFSAIAGHGIEAKVRGQEVLLGNAKLMTDRGIGLPAGTDDAERLATAGKTPMFIAVGSRFAGIIAVADPIKPESKQAIEQMHAMGLEVV